MYSGPFYYHQPGRNQHRRAYELLQRSIGDGIILGAGKIAENRLPDWIGDCRALGKAALLDPEKYDPGGFSSPGAPDGTELLLDQDMRNPYLNDALSLQTQTSCNAYLIPNFETHSISQNWFRVIRYLSEAAREWINAHGYAETKVFLTIAVSTSEITNAERRQDLINHLSTLHRELDGFYVNVMGVPQFADDGNLIRSLMHLVFQLKWQDFEVIYSKAGPWIPIMFPLGLDIFGNGGFKSQQQVRSQRGGFPRGGQRQNYFSVWSPSAMNYVRYPDDAQVFYNRFEREQYRAILGADSGFAPPADASPDDVYSSDAYDQPTRLNHFSADMARRARLFRGASLHQRIEMVQRQLSDARALERNLGHVLGDTNRGREKETWLMVFNQFIEDKLDDLEDLFL